MTDKSIEKQFVYPFDRFYHATQGRLTSGISPASVMLAYLDWAVHLLNSPGKQAHLATKAFRKGVRFMSYAERLALGKQEEPCIVPLPYDRRFAADDWRQPPFLLWYQAFLLYQQWWHNATVGVDGVSDHHQDVISFVARQILDIWSPSNFLFTNPEILKETMQKGGANLLQGFQNFIEDWERANLQKPPVGAENFRPGQEVAITPGDVVFRNHLMEVIQYRPSTKSVHPEPILIIPAWIMKYYILDLSPKNSMVRYLVDQGHTVFAISWKNPTEEDRDVGVDDYIERGIFQALKVVRAIVPEQRAHAVGYCIGGTFLAIAAAKLGRDSLNWLKSITFFAAQTDFSEAGELSLFIDKSQVSYLEDLMWDQGYLDTKQMAGAFQLLRSNDLIWSRIVREYLMGERPPMTDLMAWNADATRMPYRMHSEYLRRLFLNNELAEGRYDIDERPVALTDIHVPIFCVGAESDHVAPWKSVYKIKLLSDTDVTFLLTSGGHNAGIISEPDHAHRYFRVSTKKEGELYVAPDRWREDVDPQEGSWWPSWQAWLAERSGDKIKPPQTGNAEAGYKAISPAPGAYVLED